MSDDLGADEARVADRLAAAKLWLVSEAAGDLPYLATALYALALVPSTEVDTLSADEQWRLYANPGWVLGSGTADLASELAHVTWHLLLDHADRARSLGVDRTTARPWHLASDLTVAATTRADGVTSTVVAQAAEEARRAPRVRDLGEGRSAEEYFAVMSMLPASSSSDARDDTGDGPCGSACDGLRREHELPPDADVASVDATDARDIRHKVAVDYQGHCTRRGTEPAEGLRWARAITDPEVPWEPLLARAVRRGVAWASGRNEPTWSRPSRRASAFPGVLLPGHRRPVPQVAAVVDTSGSVDDVLLGRALGEVEGAIRALGVPGSSLTLYSCDAAVGAVSRVRRARDAQLVGGGGTDLRVAFAAITEQRPRADVVIALTDGYTPWPTQPPPGAAVIVALLARRGDPLPATPPWATRIECWL